MHTVLLQPSHLPDMQQALQLLQAGQLVAVPTETVYGLAADATNAQAVQAIFAAKGRPSNHPLIVHLADAQQMRQWAQDIPAVAWQLADAFWPGPMTLLLKKAPAVLDVVTGQLDTIGLRVPAHPVLLSLLTQGNLAVAAPSANRYKKLSPTSAQQVMAGLSGRIAAVVDGGDCQHGLESTIIDVTGDEPKILRAGPITADDVEFVLGIRVLQPSQHDVRVPGNVKAHYQPGTPLYLKSASELFAKLSTMPDDIAVIYHSALMHSAVVNSAVINSSVIDNTIIESAVSAQAPALNLTANTAEVAAQVRSSPRLRLPDDAAGFGQQLYRSLFALDQLGLKAIYLEMPPTGNDWLAVHDRLQRAQTHE